MSGINGAASPFVPVLATSGVSAGAAGGVTFAVQTLPTTGAGLTLVVLVMAIAFILAGAVILWNPLGRRRENVAAFITVPATHLRDLHQSGIDVG